MHRMHVHTCANASLVSTRHPLRLSISACMPVNATSVDLRVVFTRQVPVLPEIIPNIINHELMSFFISINQRGDKITDDSPDNRCPDYCV